jgi:hypothetical protein
MGLPETITFLERILPEPDADATYFCFATNRPQNYKCATAEAVAHRAWDFSAERRDAYMALASFRKGERRKQCYAVEARSLWLDLDCGKKDSPSYPSLKEAREALDRFVDDLGLPLPLVVVSGMGYHVYWPMTQGIAPGRWKTLAGRLKAAALAERLIADHSRTCDMASVLRVPGTLNFKYSPPLPVEIESWGDDPVGPEELEEALAEFSPAPSGRKPGRKPRHAEIPHAAFGDRRDRDPRRVYANCAQVQEATLSRVYTGRESWRLVLGVMTFCRRGREVAHMLSREDPERYDPAEVDRQFDLWEGGPPLCSTFAREKPGPCAGCPWRNQITTPVLLGDLPETMPPSLEGLVPYRDGRFEVRPGEGIWMTSLGEDGDGGGKPRLINDNEIYLTGIHVETEIPAQVERYYMFKIRTRDGDVRTCEYSVSKHSSKLMEWLGNNGVLPCTTRLNPQMRDFMGSYIASFQNRLPARERVRRFGWTDFLNYDTSKRERGFVVGDVMYTSGGPRSVVLAERCAALAKKEYTQAGTLEEWKRIPRLYRELDQPEGQLLVCAAFASPFMSSVSDQASNLVFHFWDARGGKGKTSVIMAVNSVWGHPFRLISSKSDTLPSRYQVLSVRNNLPYCMDELTTMRDDDLSAMLFDIANGLEKRKSLSGGAGLVNTGSWQTITFLTSNRSVYEILRGRSAQTVSDSMRVVEIPCTFRDYAGTPEGRHIEEVMRCMEGNHGLAGRAFMDWCLTRRKGFAEGIVREAVDFDARVRAASMERFWTYGLGVVLAAGRLAAAGGFLDYDMDALGRWVEGTLLPRLRAEVGTSEKGHEDLLARFINEHLDKTLVVASAERPPTRRPDGTRVPRGAVREGDPWVSHMPDRECFIRLELDTRRVHVNARMFDMWCADQRCSVKEVLKNLGDTGRFNGFRGKVNLGRGVSDLSAGTTVCYEFLDRKEEG